MLSFLASDAQAILSEIIDCNPVIQAVMFDISKSFVNCGINDVQRVQPLLNQIGQSLRPLNSMTLELIKAHFLRGNLAQKKKQTVYGSISESLPLHSTR